MTINLTDPIFHDEELARQHMEAIRWPNGPFCPHCGSVDGITRLQGKSQQRPGLHRSNACRGQFSQGQQSRHAERSHIPLTKWLLGFHLMAASKKGLYRLTRCICMIRKSPTKRLGSCATAFAR